MNQLTYALLAVGVLIIALVALYNWWQERKIQKILHSSLNVNQPDLLMTNEDSEDSPLISNQTIPFEDKFVLNNEVEFEIGIGEAETDSLTFDATDMVNEHSLSEFETTESDNHPSQSAPNSQDCVQDPLHPSDLYQPEIKNSLLLPDALSEEVDLIASFQLIDSIKFALSSSLIDRLNRLDKAALYFGLDKNKQWRVLGDSIEDIEFVQLVFSLQLADRSGPVNEETLLQFQSIIQDISIVLNELPEWISPKDVIAYAQSLDAFCLEVDKTMHLHLVSGSSGRFTGTKLRGLAEASGLKLNANGEFQSIAHSGQVNFVLANMENNPFSHEMLKTSLIKGITFSLDIPRADHCAEAFNQMLLIAKKMQHSLPASLTDDRKKELSDHQIEKIRQQLKLIQTHMATRGIPSGSPIALRLFS